MKKYYFFKILPFLIFIAIGPLTFIAVDAQQTAFSTDIKTAIDDIVKPYLDDENTRGLSVAMHQNGKTTFFHYGEVEQEGGLPPDNSSLYEIGSITKTFTGHLLAIMVNKGLVSLDDPISKYLPNGLGDWSEDKSITMVDLVTHNSGLPRIPGNLLPKMMTNMDNPYSQYTVEDLYSFIKDYKPVPRSDRKPEYSNLGMGLLGHILALVEGKSYEACLNNYIFSPLGMEASTITLDGQKLIQGYNVQGQPAPHWDIPTLGGAGAIISNIEDMAIYLKANMSDEDNYKITQQPIGIFGEKMEIGYAWIIQEDTTTGQKMIWHNGGTGGFRSFLGFYENSGMGIVVLSNSAQSVDLVGVKILQYLAGNK